MGCASTSCCRCFLNRYVAVPTEPEGTPSCSSTHTGVTVGRTQDHSSGELAEHAPRQACLSSAGRLPHLRKHATPSPDSLLAEGSWVHGFHIQPWADGPQEGAGGEPPGGEREGGTRSTLAGTRLQLNAAQQRLLDCWCRLPDLLRSRDVHSALTVFNGPLESSAIVQGFVTDCSLISAFSVLAEYEQRFGEPVLSGIIYPKQCMSGRLEPVASSSGVYCCRLFFNGIARKVFVDDHVPAGTHGQLLCSHSARENELWVTLLEKAITQVMGGSYEMPGSNPGTDLFHLTGWVPETVALRDDSADSTCPDVLQSHPRQQDMTAWLRLFDAALQGYHGGHCVICVGTSELPDVRPDAEASRRGCMEGVSSSTGLVARHAYPVLDCQRVDGFRLLFLRNPWGRVQWRGSFSPKDAVWRGSPGLTQALRYSTEHAEDDDGCFWIEWTDVLRYFSHLYLCWSPRALGLHRLEVHHRWQPESHGLDSTLSSSIDLVAFDPQFHLHLDGELPDGAGDTAVWALVSRHVRCHEDARAPFVAVGICAGGARQCSLDPALAQGAYSNGECTLLKLSRERACGHRDFVLAVSQHGGAASFNFTLQVYAAAPGTLTPLPPLVPDGSSSGTVRGQWTPRTAGGCSNSVWSYFRNPQWCLTVPSCGLPALTLIVECPANYTINTRVFEGLVALPDGLRRAASSGAYKRSCCVLRMENLTPGPYVVVVSTFHSGLCTGFRLSWHATHPIELRPQPHPFAGALGFPLLCSVRTLGLGRHSWLRMRADDRTGMPSRVSARLEMDFSEAGLPVLALFHSKSTAEPAPCELLQDADRKQYFGLSGAVVIVLAELAPADVYLLEIIVPRPDVAVGEAKLYINSDRPITVQDAAAGTPERH